MREFEQVPDRLLRDLARTPIVPEAELDVYLETATGSVHNGRLSVAAGLEPVERRMLELYSHGLTRTMIADTLHLSLETVKDYLTRARYRLKAKNTAHAACIAIRRGLIR